MYSSSTKNYQKRDIKKRTVKHVCLHLWNFDHLLIAFFEVPREHLFEFLGSRGEDVFMRMDFVFLDKKDHVREFGVVKNLLKIRFQRRLQNLKILL